MTSVQGKSDLLQDRSSDTLGRLPEVQRQPLGRLHPRELFGVQGVAAGMCEELRLRLGGKQRPLQQGSDQSRGVLVREWPE